MFDLLAKEAKNDYMKVVSKLESGQGYIDTGSYILNAVVSGSIYGGIPENRITGLAGEQSTGKTYYAMEIAKNFLESNKDGAVFYFDTESATSKDMFVDRGFDSDRVYIFPVDTLEDFRTQIIRILDNMLNMKEKERKPLMIILDSLGMLPSAKELTDALDDKQVRDMTKAQIVKSIFRLVTGRLGRLKVPMIVTNHTFKTMNPYGEATDMGGGSGLKYAASTIIHLSKSKEKDGTEVVGGIIKAKMNKSRFTKETVVAPTRLFFDERGLDRHYGLLEIAEKYGIFDKEGTRYLIDGKKYYGSDILKNPEKFYTPEVLEKIDWAVGQEFKLKA